MKKGLNMSHSNSSRSNSSDSRHMRNTSSYKGLTGDVSANNGQPQSRKFKSLKK